MGSRRGSKQSTGSVESQSSASIRHSSKQLTGSRRGSKESTNSVEPQSSGSRVSTQARGGRRGSKESTGATPRISPTGAAARLLLGKTPSAFESGASPRGRQIQQIACRGRIQQIAESGYFQASDGDDWESAVNAVAAKMQQVAETAIKRASELPVKEAQLLKIQQLRLMLEEFVDSVLPAHIKLSFDTHFNTLGSLVGAPPKIFDPEFYRAVTHLISVFKSRASTNIVISAVWPM